MTPHRRSISSPLQRWRRSIAVAACAALIAASCGGDDDASPSSPGDTADDVVTADDAAPADDATVAPLVAAVSFYPLEFLMNRVGGDAVAVTNLTPVGGEPHDLEITPQGMTTLVDADLIVYLSGFAPAFDDAVEGLDADKVVDVASFARLDLAADEHDHEDEHGDHEDEHDHDDEHGDHDDEHGDHEDELDHEDEHGDHDHGGVDPHFWLDPIRLADVADAVAEHLGEIDPAQAVEFGDRAAVLRTELETLDTDFTTGLAECASREIVTSHDAFGYLAQRFDLTQVGIAGLRPDDEPSTAELAVVADFVSDHGVTTIYYETLVDPAIAETIAAETGASTMVLDPIEGLADTSAGSDYLEVMRSNLDSLRAGQGCE